MADLAAFIDEHGTLGVGLYNEHSGDLTGARAALSDRYCGCYSSLASYMEEVNGRSAAMPQGLASYIDYDAMGRDAEMSGDVFKIRTAHDEVHVFAG